MAGMAGMAAPIRLDTVETDIYAKSFAHVTKPETPSKSGHILSFLGKKNPLPPTGDCILLFHPAIMDGLVTNVILTIEHQPSEFWRMENKACQENTWK